MADNVPENLKQRLKDSYDVIAPKYNAWTLPNSENRLKYLDKLIPLLKSADSGSKKISVLELGCGAGLPTTQILLSHDNFHVTANDLSSTQIEAARENLASEDVGERLTLIGGDMTTLTFAEQSFDAVVGMYSLIHLPRAEQGELVVKIAQWLKPGGYFLANFSEEAIEGQVLDKWLDDKGWMYWSGFGAEVTPKKVEEAGLEIVVNEVSKDAVSSSFLWIIAKKAN
jgi:ubiquinone/menaquinone biosynthesis C-methylase UbiE